MADTEKKEKLPSMTHAELIAEINRVDGLLDGLYEIQVRITDKVAAMRLRLQNLNKRLQKTDIEE